jgi:hypothetical protein
MKKMKMLITLAGALTVLAFSAGAWAQDEEAVDWDEAIEFAEITDTYVENGVTWETYYDELQNVMWSQPADASPEAVLAYHNGDLEKAKDLGLDCNVYWPYPEYLKILVGTSGDPETFTSFNLDYSGPLVKRYEAVTWGALDDVDGYVTSRLYNRTNYCSEHEGYVWEQDTEAGGGSGGDPYWDFANSDNCQFFLNTYLYTSYHWTTVEDWEYLDDTTTSVTGHSFYACGETRVVYLVLSVVGV